MWIICEHFASDHESWLQAWSLHKKSQPPVTSLLQFKVRELESATKEKEMWLLWESDFPYKNRLFQSIHSAFRAAELALPLTVSSISTGLKAPVRLPLIGRAGYMLSEMQNMPVMWLREAAWKWLTRTHLLRETWHQSVLKKWTT